MAFELRSQLCTFENSTKNGYELWFVRSTIFFSIARDVQRCISLDLVRLFVPLSRRYVTRQFKAVCNFREF